MPQSRRSLIAGLFALLLFCACASQHDQQAHASTPAPYAGLATPSDFARANSDDAADELPDDPDAHTPAQPRCGREVNGNANTTSECEANDLQAGNWATVTCPTGGSVEKAEDCAGQRFYGEDDAFVAAIHRASAGTITAATSYLYYGNIIDLSVLLNDKDEIDRVLSRHGNAAITKALAAWQPVYARYHHGDRGVCVRVLDDSLNAEEGRAIGFDRAQYQSPILMERCTAH